MAKEQVITGEEVEFHEGKKISLPKGMTYKRAFSILQRLQEEAETPTQFDRTFLYRPDDGAHATYHCMRARWGMALGKITETFFGTRPAESRTIPIAYGKTMQVPWGRVEVPHLEGLEFFILEDDHKEYGKVFKLYARGPKKHKAEVEALFDDVQEFLQTKSIYRGQALIGSDTLEFLNLDIDLSKIIFSDKVMEELGGMLWSSLRYSEAMRAEGLSLKRAVLLHGPYGTGKTSTGLITAKEAVEAGWTFLSAKPGKDKVENVLRTARLYEPAVVFVEDIDNQTSNGEADAVSRLLDAFDGITSKGGELMIVLTTNHLDRIHKGMLRPGRLDAIVEIAGLDRGGCERLIRAVVPDGKLSEDVNYDEVYKSMDGFLPAFVRETINRAVTFAVARTQGRGSYIIDTADLVHAAESLHPQLAALTDAGEGVKRPTLDKSLENLVLNSLAQTKTFDGHTDEYYAVEVDGHEPIKA
jgi:transitional endoplasmic reticulum ATPase